ncbi:MAG TPA: YcaO-like family protein [Planosporangium sp.]|nr:YcaO-like family protein [Planosporangium sp.]
MTWSPADLTALGPEVFGATPTVTEAGHCRPLAETWAWIQPVLSRVPVTRIYDATPLDVLGLPIWSAVTPLAKDLTVHAGKGASALAAKVSAAMEAIERVSAESIPAERVRKASFDELVASADEAPPVDPRLFDLAYDSAYRPEDVISWTAAYDLMREEHCWVPVDLVVSPASEGVCTGTETNGLASGNGYTEATLHALYEVVERDAIAEEDFYHLHHDPADRSRRPVRLFEAGTLPDPARGWVAGLVAAGLRAQVQDLTNDVGIPVVRVTIVDASYPGAEGETLSFAGFGADLDPGRAVVRAVTEAAQSHTGVMLGARDEFEGMRTIAERPAMLHRRLEVLYGDGSRPFPTPGAGGDLFSDLHEVLRRLRAAGHDRCLVTELTRPDLGVPVVRVLVPGLAAPYGDSSRAPTVRLLSAVV